jgi:hypothetical protein
VGDEVFGRGQHTQAEYAVLGSWAVKPPSTVGVCLPSVCELLVEPTSRKRDGPTVVNRLAQRPGRG